MSISCPFSKGYFSHQRGLNPMRIFFNVARSDKWWTLSGNFVQFHSKIMKRVIAKSRAYVSGITKLLVFIIVAEQKRAYADPGTLGVGKTANYKFLALRTLQLYPVGRAARGITRSFALTDQAFQPQAAGRGDYIFRRRIENIAEAYRFRRRWLKKGSE